MQIKRWVSDFGNSMCQHMVDGLYFELPSAIAELTAAEADGLFSEAISEEKLLKNLLIKVSMDGTERYFKVGEKAQGYALANAHIDRLHDKSESLTVMITWLASIAYFQAKKQPGSEGQENVHIDYFLTLLPVWLVKRADRFASALRKMADRFAGEHHVSLLTPGWEREITVAVKDTVCRVEGETARFALKYDLELNLREEADVFKDAYAVINDLGGQSQDLSKLPPGLGMAQDKDDFASSTDQSYLHTLELLRTSKLMTHFNDVRALEAFILEHVRKREYIYMDPTTQEKTNFSECINRTLHNFAKVAMQKSLHAFQFAHGQKVYFVHIGGVNQVLQSYMQEYLDKTLGKEIASQYHIFPEDSRKLNLYAGEIVAKSELKRREKAKADA